MQGHLAALALLILPSMVATRVVLLRRRGTRAFHFGNVDKTDFLIVPFVLLYFVAIFAAAFSSPLVRSRVFFRSDVVAWIGVGFCFGSLIVLLLSLFAFGQSFRVGIDADKPAELVTTGIFARSRNPIFVGFSLMLLGQFLVFANWPTVIALAAGVWLFHRQVLREEAFMRAHYGYEYVRYCDKVRRYF